MLVVVPGVTIEEKHTASMTLKWQAKAVCGILAHDSKTGFFAGRIS
jgi:hypothetical protein